LAARVWLPRTNLVCRHRLSALSPLIIVDGICLLSLGIAGSALLYILTPPSKRGLLGATIPAEGVGIGEAFGIEFVLTFLLVLTVFACTDPKRQHYGYEVPLAIGFCVVVCHLTGVRIY